MSVPNVSNVSRLAAARPVVTALHISPSLRDREILRDLSTACSWCVYTASTCSEGLALIRLAILPVVLCQRDLCDGDWKSILGVTSGMPQPPRLIVCSRPMNFELPSEVRRMGGHSVLTSPFKAGEVEVKVELAWQSWQREWHKIGAASTPAMPSAFAKEAAARQPQCTQV